MNYDEKFNEAMESYEKLVAEYNEKISSEAYEKAMEVSPFPFISAINVCELLEAFNSEPHPLMPYISAEDAESTYKRILKFGEIKDEVAEMASTVNEVENLVKKINNLVDENPYLPASLKKNENKVLGEFAERTLKLVPTYSKLKNKTFRDKFTESCLETLDTTSLDKLAMNGIIKSVHLDSVRIDGSPTYKANFNHMCVNVFDKSFVPLRKFSDVKLVGVSYANEDGKNRQELLREMCEEIAANKRVQLKAKLTEYVPELGAPEPSVIVYWNNQIVGFLNKESAKQIAEMEKEDKIDIEMSVHDIRKIENTYGCRVNVQVNAYIKNEKASGVQLQEEPEKEHPELN